MFDDTYDEYGVNTKNSFNTPMHTIWFRPHGSSSALSVEVNEVFASHVWDLLSKEFLMVSTRPETD